MASGRKRLGRGSLPILVLRLGRVDSPRQGRDTAAEKMYPGWVEGVRSNSVDPLGRREVECSPLPGRFDRPRGVGVGYPTIWITVAIRMVGVACGEVVLPAK